MQGLDLYLRNLEFFYTRLSTSLPVWFALLESFGDGTGMTDALLKTVLDIPKSRSDIFGFLNEERLLGRYQDLSLSREDEPPFCTKDVEL